MNTTLSIKFSRTDRKAAIVLAMFAFLFVILTITQDLVRSDLKNYAFYFSESFMFSSFWWLFAPLLFGQYFVVKHGKNKIRPLLQFAVVVLPGVVHLFAFPCLVWAVSKTFYYHTYSLQQTFRYALSEHIYLLVVLYSIPVLTFQYFTKMKPAEATPEIADKHITEQFITAVVVSEGNKKQSVLVSEILYFSANPPYINLHLDGKRYLLNETLRSISIKLDPLQFIRVHRSAIVNISMVASYKTRLNGDYDLTLKNNLQLRVSRNFAAGFKDLFKTHQLATK